MKHHLLFFVVIIICTFTSLSHSKLLFVLEHFRHGARNPCDNLDGEGNDYMGQKWNKLGELNEIGTRMHYVLGLYVFEKYKDFLSTTYNPFEIHVSSTNLSRTIQSAMAHTNAFYYNTGKTVSVDVDDTKYYPPVDSTNNIKSSITDLGQRSLPLNYQTMPIHIFHPADHDFLLQEENGDCSRVKSQRSQNLKTSEEVQKQVEQFYTKYGKNLLKFQNKYPDGEIDEKTEKKLNETYLTNFTYYNYICDHFIADYTQGINLTYLESNLTSSELSSNLSSLEKDCQTLLSVKLFNIVFNSDQGKFTRMTQTPPMRKMINYFKYRRDLSLSSFIPRTDDVIDKIEKGKPRFVIWSGHDTTVGGTQMFFNELNKELNVSCDPKSKPSKIGESCENNITQFKVNPTYAGNVFIEFHINDTFLKDETKNITSEDEFDKYNNNFFVKYYINGQEYYTYNYTEFLNAANKILASDSEVESYCGFEYRKETRRTSLSITLLILIFIAAIAATCAFIFGLKSGCTCNMGMQEEEQRNSSSFSEII